METKKLIGAALDWAVAKCEGKPLIHMGRLWPTDGATEIAYAPWTKHVVTDGCGPYVPSLCRQAFTPSTDWAQGGPIIDREKIAIDYPAGECAATLDSWDKSQTGPTPLIAAMRCYVASNLGDEVEIPQKIVPSNVEVSGG